MSTPRLRDHSRASEIILACPAVGVLLDELVRRRVALGIAQGALADALKIHSSTLGCWECGHAIPALPAFLRWAGALGCRVELATAGTVRLVEMPAPTRALRPRQAEERFAEALAGRGFAGRAA